MMSSNDLTYRHGTTVGSVINGEATSDLHSACRIEIERLKSAVTDLGVLSIQRYAEIERLRELLKERR